MAKNSKDITIEQLNAEEKQSLTKLLRFAYGLYSSAATDYSFKIWLDMLGEGLHDAQNAQNKKGKNN